MNSTLPVKLTDAQIGDRFLTRQDSAAGPIIEIAITALALTPEGRAWYKVEIVTIEKTTTCWVNHEYLDALGHRIFARVQDITF